MSKQTRKTIAKPTVQVPLTDPHEHHHVEGECSQMLTTLGEYVDGDLSPELCAELERHIKGCPRCRIVVDTLKKTIELYHETSEEAHIPSDVRARLYAKLNLEDYQK
jgi:anti-sigma factor (TIGR02949 family)